MIEAKKYIMDLSQRKQCMDGFNDVFGDGALSTVFIDGKACNKETFEDIRERLNGGN